MVVMAAPRLTVPGVYRPQISVKTWREQREVIGNDDATREHFDKLVLIEALIEDLDEPFDMGKFGQMHSEFPKDKVKSRRAQGLCGACGKNPCECKYPVRKQKHASVLLFDATSRSYRKRLAPTFLKQPR